MIVTKNLRNLISAWSEYKEIYGVFMGLLAIGIVGTFGSVLLIFAGWFPISTLFLSAYSLIASLIFLVAALIMKRKHDRLFKELKVVFK